MLRTRFIEVDGEPRQELLAEAVFVLHERAMPGVAEAERREHLQGLLSIEDGIAFDLSQAPLLKVELIRYDAACHGLLLKMHHIVSDAWSNPILVADLASAYAQALRGDTRACRRWRCNTSITRCGSASAWGRRAPGRP